MNTKPNKSEAHILKAKHSGEIASFQTCADEDRLFYAAHSLVKKGLAEMIDEADFLGGLDRCTKVRTATIRIK